MPQAPPPEIAEPAAAQLQTASEGARAANLVAQMAFGLLVMTICLPSMQEWPAIFNTSQANVQLTFSVYLLTYGALQLLYGPLSDRYGRRRLLLLGLALAFLGMVAAALATRIETLIAARALQGCGCAACLVIGRASVQDLFTGPQRTRMMAYVGMAMGLCPPTGTVIGGQLHVRLGWQSNFIVMAVLCLVLMVTAWRCMPAHAGRAADRSTLGAGGNPVHWLRAMGSAYAQLARERDFLLNVTILALGSSAFYAFLGGAPAVLGAYGVGPGEVGFFIMMTPLSYIMGNYLSTHLVLRLGESWMRLTGHYLTLTGIVLLLVLALVGWRSPFAFSGPLMLLGIGHGLLTPPTLAATVGLVPALAGAAAAVAGVSQQVLGAVGGYAVGWISLRTPVQLACLMLSFTSLALLAQWTLMRRPRPAAAPPKQRANS